MDMEQYGELTQHAILLMEKEFPLLEGIDDLADRLGVSKCHLIRVFKNDTGTSPGKYLCDVRLSAVRAYLSTTDYNVETIAGITGFACGNYLCKVFRKNVGVSPLAYRSKNSDAKAKENDLQRRSDDLSFI